MTGRPSPARANTPATSGLKSPFMTVAPSLRSSTSPSRSPSTRTIPRHSRRSLRGALCPRIRIPARPLLSLPRPPQATPQLPRDPIRATQEIILRNWRPPTTHRGPPSQTHHHIRRTIRILNWHNTATLRPSGVVTATLTRQGPAAPTTLPPRGLMHPVDPWTGTGIPFIRMTRHSHPITRVILQT